MARPAPSHTGTATRAGTALLRAVWRPLPLALLLGVLAALLALLALAQPWYARLEIGGPLDSPYLRDFHRAEYSNEHQTGFRWSLPRASIVLPGAGKLAPLQLRVHGEQQASSLRLAMGHGSSELALRPGWQRLHLLAPADPWSGDVRLHLTAPEQTSAADPRPRGLVVSELTATGTGRLLPGQALLPGLSTALLVLLLAWGTRRTWPAALAGLALALGSGAVLALNQGAWRLLLTDYTGRLLLVLLLALLLAPLFGGLLGWLHRRGVVPLSPATRRTLVAVALLAFGLRFGAMAYPLNHNSDLPFILGRTWLVREGHLLSLFLPNPALTPVQWELDVTIPRSPFYYILTTPVTLLPGYQGDELGMLAFSSAIDALAVLLVGLLARAAGGSGRAAVCAALLAALLPFGLLLIVSWGIFPTIFAQTLSLAVLLLWLHLRPHLHTRRAWLLLAAAMALAYVAYPTALVFLGATWGLLWLCLLLRRDPATWPTFRAGVLALAVAFVLFYGWHTPAMLAQTLPTLAGEAIGETAPTTDTGGGFSAGRTWDAISVQPMDKYGGLIVALAGVGGLLLLNRIVSGQGGQRVRSTGLLLLVWALAYLPFALIDEYVVTLILKHVLHLLPLLAVLGGLLLGRLAHPSAGRAGRLVVGLVLAWVGWQGLVLLVDVVTNAFVQLK